MAALYGAAKRRVRVTSIYVAFVAAFLMAVNFVVASGAQAQGTANVFCVVKRDVPHAGKMIAEHSVVRCDNLAGIGAEWRVLSRNLTFAAASAQRDSLNASEAPAVWCVATRDVMFAGRMITEQTVVRCDNLASIGAEWRVLSRNLTFAAANAQRDALSAANAPPVWCVARRDVMLAGRMVPEFTTVRCDNLAGIGAEWRVVARDLTFAAASADRDARNAAAGRTSPGMTINQAAAICSTQIPGSVPGNRNADGAYTCICINGQVNIGGRCVDERTIAAAQCTAKLPGSVVGSRNADGSYQCNCPAGQGNLNGRCTDGREIAAAQCTAQLPGGVVGSRNADGGYQCTCPLGQGEINGRCVDEREIAAAQCAAQLPGGVVGSRNADGSYNCVCPTGLVSNGAQCSRQVTQQPQQQQPRPPAPAANSIFIGSWRSKIGVNIVLRADRTGSWVDNRKPGLMQGGGDFPGTWVESIDGVTLTIARRAGYGPERAGPVSFRRQPNGSLKDPWGNEYSR